MTSPTLTHPLIDDLFVDTPVHQDWLGLHKDQVLAVMRSLAHDNTSEGARVSDYFDDPHPHYGQGSDALAEDCAFALTDRYSPYYDPTAPNDLYADNVADDRFYAWALALARETHPTYRAPHSADEAHPAEATGVTPLLRPVEVAAMRADTDRDLAQTLRDAETRVMQYELTYESPVDPSLEVRIIVRSSRVVPRQPSR